MRHPTVDTKTPSIGSVLCTSALMRMNACRVAMRECTCARACVRRTGWHNKPKKTDFLLKSQRHPHERLDTGTCPVSRLTLSLCAARLSSRFCAAAVNHRVNGQQKIRSMVRASDAQIYNSLDSADTGAKPQEVAVIVGDTCRGSKSRGYRSSGSTVTANASKTKSSLTNNRNTIQVNKERKQRAR